MERRYRQTRPRNKTIAALFSLFFGSFGVHKFYLKEPGAGIFYIFLFFMTSRIIFPVSGILGIFDAIRLFNMSQQEFDAKYNKEFAGQTQRQTGRPVPQKTKAPFLKSKSIPKSNPFIKSGLKKYKEFELEGAIADFNNALNINPDDIAVHFNLACAYSLTEKKEKGFTHLARAVELGFKDFEKIQTHDDLAYLRIQKEFDGFKASGFRNWEKTEREETTNVENNSSNTQQEPMDDVLLSQLNKLMELRKKGILSELEFELERKKLMQN
jgi:TM2 domain-containing membrane protein YozV